MPDELPPITKREWYWIHVAVKRFHDKVVNKPGGVDLDLCVWPGILEVVRAHARDAGLGDIIEYEDDIEKKSPSFLERIRTALSPWIPI